MTIMSRGVCYGQPLYTNYPSFRKTELPSPNRIIDHGSYERTSGGRQEHKPRADMNPLTIVPWAKYSELKRGHRNIRVTVGNVQNSGLNSGFGIIVICRVVLKSLVRVVMTLTSPRAKQYYPRQGPTVLDVCKVSASPVVPLVSIRTTGIHSYTLGGCKNSGPLLGPLNTRCRIMLRTHKGPIILTTNHMMNLYLYLHLYLYTFNMDSPKRDHDFDNHPYDTFR